MAYVEHPVFANGKLKLMAKKLKDASFPASLKMDIYQGNPSLYVSTGFKKDSGIPTYVKANFEPKTAGILCSIIEKVANMQTPNDKPYVVEIECLHGKEREIASKIAVGKDLKGACFISVIDMKNQQAPIIQFFFTQDYYHPVKFPMMDKDENWSTVSCIAAIEWAKRARQMWYTDMVVNPPEQKEKNSSNNNNNNNSNSDGGYTGPTDDDVPW